MGLTTNCNICGKKYTTELDKHSDLYYCSKKCVRTALFLMITPRLIWFGIVLVSVGGVVIWFQ